MLSHLCPTHTLLLFTICLSLSPNHTHSVIHGHILSLFKRLCPRGTQQSAVTGDMHFPSLPLLSSLFSLSFAHYLLSLLFRTLSVGQSYCITFSVLCSYLCGCVCVYLCVHSCLIGRSCCEQICSGLQFCPERWRQVQYYKLNNMPQ